MDHPRSRGEYAKVRNRVQAAEGSSPLSRGILIHPGNGLLGDRIIPALAGNTAASRASLMDTRDHPRSRGEYTDVPAGIHTVYGSSPLSRGIRPNLHRFPLLRRIIPALAGNTDDPSVSAGGDWDHPRSRGEYTASACAQFQVPGSSPLSRGILEWTPYSIVSGRIIPALAGNTGPAGPGLPSAPDHPRSRGEYAVGKTSVKLARGSSPLSRGILMDTRGGRLLIRIIPALAGNTHDHCYRDHYCSDHPRSRGEYAMFRRRFKNRDRIIPALAGNTPSTDSQYSSLPDHPRSRGEYYNAKVEQFAQRGSSPLSRGIPSHV